MDRRKFIKRIVKATPLVVIGATGLGTLAATKLHDKEIVITSKTWNPKPINWDDYDEKMWDPVDLDKRIKEAYKNIPRDLLDPSLTFHVEHEKLLNRIETKHLLGKWI